MQIEGDADGMRYRWKEMEGGTDERRCRWKKVQMEGGADGKGVQVEGKREHTVVPGLAAFQ